MSLSRLPAADNQVVKYESLDTFSCLQVRIIRVRVYFVTFISVVFNKTGDKVYFVVDLFYQTFYYIRKSCVEL